jgi:DNA polymerase-3 subunit delta
VFDLAAAIGARDHGRVLDILARNLEAGEAPVRILGSLVWQYRQVWKAKELLRQSGREADAARLLRIQPFKVKEFLGQFSEIHLREGFRLFMETDSRLKGGSATAPALVLEALLLTLCRLERAPGPKANGLAKTDPSQLAQLARPTEAKPTASAPSGRGIRAGRLSTG